MRPCTVIIRIPHSSAIRARVGALRLSSSQPVRIFRVTGTSTARTVASRIRPASDSSRISADPASLLTTFFTGQPKLMSMIAAPRSTFSRAASAMISGSWPASCTAMGNSSAQSVELRMDARAARTISWLAIISDTTSPAPCPRTMSRKGRSVTPDIGARMTGSSMRTGPNEMPIFWALG